MSSREEVLHLIHSYAFTIDSGDLEGFAGLFEHAQWIMEGAAPIVGKEQWLRAISVVILYDDGTPRTKHVTSNIDLDIDEASGKATCQSYVTVLQQTEKFPLQVIFSGHYFDEFERVDGKWRFTKRLIRNQLVGDMSAHLKDLGVIIPGKQ